MKRIFPNMFSYIFLIIMYKCLFKPIMAEIKSTKFNNTLTSDLSPYHNSHLFYFPKVQ